MRNEDDLQFRRQLRESVRRNSKAMESCSIFTVIFSRNYEDDAVAVLQFGLAVLMDKPIYLIVEEGKVLNENVKRLCRGTATYREGDQASLEAATTSLITQAAKDLDLPN